jgi:hypothetical protein
MGLAELIETKKMSKEEFEEHEHPRDSDGKFRKKNEGAKGGKKSKNKKKEDFSIQDYATKRNVAISLVGAYAGYKLTRNSNVFKRFRDSKIAKEEAEKIISANGTTDFTKAKQGILDIEIVDEIGVLGKTRTALSNNESELYNFVRDPDKLQTSLSKQFGHLDIGASPKIVIHRNSPTIAQFKGNLERAGACYDPLSDTLYVNLKQASMLKSYGLNPKQLVIHEYAHAITMNGKAEATAFHEGYRQVFNREVKKFKGKTMTLRNKDYIIDDVLIEERTMLEFQTEDYEKLRDAYDQTPNPVLKSMRDYVKKELDQLKNRPDLKDQMMSRTSLKLDGGGFPYYVDCQDLNTQVSLEAALKSKIPFYGDTKGVVKIDGKPALRDVYYLASSPEYVAVMSERGKRL